MQMLNNNIKTGFKPSFWTANIMELFERLAYYGQMAILALFLSKELKFTPIQIGIITSVFGGLIYFLPIFAGALVDKFKFKKSFSLAFFVLAIGYFLMATTKLAPFEAFYSGLGINIFYIVLGILIFTAMGGSFIKPSVLGTISLTSSEHTKSIGYAIYYWLVNIGGALGPFIALFVRENIGMYAVYFVSALSCTLMFFASIFIFKEPENNEVSQNVNFGQIIKNMLVVVTNFKFMIFLIIFSLFWLMFWQIYVIIPLYITDYINPNAPIEVIISAGAWGIIALQLVVNYFTKKLSPIKAIILGFGIAGSSWLIILSHNILPFVSPIVLIVLGVVIFSIGEMTQAPRYYEYIADLAPSGQTAMYQGFAFLPIAIGWFFGGNLGGWLYQTYAKQAHNPEMIFVILLIIGAASVILMSLYNYIAKPKMK